MQWQDMRLNTHYLKKCVIEADSLEEAKDKAHTAEDEEIESMEIENTGYVVWEEPKKI